MSYIAWIRQRGEGCDYTIGCGHNLYELKAETQEEAFAAVEAMMAETVCFDHAEQYEAITIYEVVDIYEVNVDALYKKEEARLATLAAQDIEQKEKALYERLRGKYEID